MKNKTKKLFRSMISLMLILCMVLTLVPATALAAGNEEEPIIYASVGDSMTNGYCLEGYDGESGALNYAMQTYGNKFAAWLAGYTGAIEDDQLIFEGSKGIVDHRPLAISGMRSEDIQWILTLDYDNDELMKAVYDMDYSSSWNESTWYDTWNFVGDRRTWADFCDYDYRYADAAAKILAMYNNGVNDKYYETSAEYADETAIANAINGLKNDAYFPQGREQSQSIGGYKYLQIATEYYQKSMKDADVISLAVGNTNFGTFMLRELIDVVMSDDTSFAGRYKLDKIMEKVAGNTFVENQVEEMMNSDGYKKSVAVCKALAGGDTSKEERIEYIIEYCVASYIVGYIGMMDAILEMNPDVEIIQVALMNAYEQQDGTVEEGTLGALVDVIYAPVNQFLKNLPENLMASKTAEEQEKYAQAKFYWAEADYVSCMVDVFGDDYYKKNDDYVKYPGLLTGNEGYTANEKSTVRARFVEEIVCGDMLFAALGLKKDNTQENIQKFLTGAISYDMKTPVQKAAFAAQDANAAKEYALYLAFENALIRSGTESVTIEALANLGSIQSKFAQFQGGMMGAIGIASADYYDEAAVIVAAGSNGALTEAQVVEIMNAVEAMKDQVWAGYGDYHEALKEQTGHISIDHVIQCSTCMDGDGHGSAIAQQIVATYKEQMELLPYTIVAKMAESQTGGLLDGADIKRLCEAADYEAEVYKLVAEKSGGQLNEDQVKTLANEEDGVFVVADQVTGGEYGVSMIKLAYEKGLLDEEQKGQIDTLFTVRDAVKALLEKNDAGEYKNKSVFVSSVAGIKSAIEAASSLAYLLALPQTMADELYNDKNMQGAFCMDARCLLGTGAGGHPSVNGHDALYNAVLASMEDVPCEHDYIEKVVKATTKKNGKIEEVCKICGEKGKSTIIYYPKTIKLSKTSFVYNNKVQKPTVTVTGSNGKKIAAKNYTVKFVNAKKAVGQYTVKITFKGNYSGTVNKTYKIVPKGTTVSKLTNAKKAITVKWKKQATQTTGYEIQMATDKAFTKNKKLTTVTKTATVSKKVTGLKAKTKYFVRIRTYKTVKINGKSTKIYSAWSVAKNVKTK